MAGSRGGAVVGCLGPIVICCGILLCAVNPIIGIVVLVLGLAVLCSPKGCQLCGNPIKRNSYTWQIDGKQQVVCPKCNQTLARQNSKQATDRLLHVGNRTVGSLSEVSQRRRTSWGYVGCGGLIAVFVVLAVVSHKPEPGFTTKNTRVARQASGTLADAPSPEATPVAHQTVEQQPNSSDVSPSGTTTVSAEAPFAAQGTTAEETEGDLFRGTKRVGNVKAGDPVEKLSLSYGEPDSTGTAEMLLGVGNEWPGREFVLYRANKLIVICRDGIVEHFFVGVISKTPAPRHEEPKGSSGYYEAISPPMNRVWSTGFANTHSVAPGSYYDSGRNTGVVPSGAVSSGQKPVHVNSYTRSDGTVVREHLRSAPK